MSDLLGRDAPTDEHKHDALEFITLQAGSRMMSSEALATFIAQRDWRLMQRFEKALRGISATLPAGFEIRHDVHGNYRVHEITD